MARKDYSVLKNFFTPTFDVYSVAEPLSSLIRNTDTGIEDVVWGFVKGQYLYKLPSGRFDNSYLKRLPIIDALLHRGYEVSDFQEELGIELNVSKGRAQIEAAGLSLKYGCHKRKSLAILKKFARRRTDIDLRAGAKIALYQAGAIKCLLAEYVAEIRRGCTWNPLHTSYLIGAASPKAINKLRFVDFRLLALLRQDTDACTCTSKLLFMLLSKRKFKNIAQKMDLLVALRRKGHSLISHSVSK